MFFNRFYPKSYLSTKQFLFGLNLELQGGLKVSGSEINFIIIHIKITQIKKSLRICYTSFKRFSNKSTRIFWFEQLLFNKVDFTASNFEAALQLQIEVKWKTLGRSVTFGPKSVEKQLIKGTLENLTTPNGEEQCTGTEEECPR